MTAVKSVFHNFVAYAALLRYGPTHGRNLSLIPDRVFQARFAKKATKQTWICTSKIFAVGVFYSKTPTATKYRAEVVSRKVNEDPEYDPLESWTAAALSLAPGYFHVVSEFPAYWDTYMYNEHGEPCKYDDVLKTL